MLQSHDFIFIDIALFNQGQKPSSGWALTCEVRNYQKKKKKMVITIQEYRKQ